MKPQFNMVSTVRTIAALTLITLAGNAYAQLMKPEDAIKTRKAGYAFMAWNMGKIKIQVVEAPQAYKKDEVVRAAQAIAAINNSGMGALYLPGSDKDVNGEKTRAKPEMFTDREGVANAAKDFKAEADKLVEIANGGDIDAIKAQFGKVSESCKACHKKYRSE